MTLFTGFTHAEDGFALFAKNLRNVHFVCKAHFGMVIRHGFDRHQFALQLAFFCPGFVFRRARFGSNFAHERGHDRQVGKKGLLVENGCQSGVKAVDVELVGVLQVNCAKL